MLVATRNRFDLLTQQCIDAIRQQSVQPALTVIVNDGRSFSPAEHAQIQTRLAPLRGVVLQNRHAPGAAGAWNTGLDYIRRHHDGFVALLDDDDEWDADHLEANQAVALECGADIVVSGLRRVVDGTNIPRPLVTSINARDFLVGNPGWQGSNTFVSVRRLSQVRGFRNGLASLNDRDLAFRLLASDGVRVAFTGTWTASWHVSSHRTALSSPRSAAKISGLRWFWRIYRPKMSMSEAAAFLQRADRCFGVLPDEILDPGDDVPPHTHPDGDLDP